MSEFWQVYIASPPYQALTYQWPREFPRPVAGMRVLVPMGNSRRVGVLAEPVAEAPKGVALKPVYWPLETEPLLNSSYMEMVRELALRQTVDPGRILEAVLPRGLRTSQVNYLVEPGEGRSFPGVMKASALGKYQGEDRVALLDLWDRGRMRVRLDPKREEQERFVSLQVEPPWPVRPNAHRQISLLEYLYEHGFASLYALKHVLGDWTGDCVAKLAKLGAVRVGDLDAEMQEQIDGTGPIDSCIADEYDYAPTEEQALALEGVRQGLESGGGIHLIHGVTGSGKTHLYMLLARQVLEAGKSVVLLAPEVALAGQLHRDACCYFPGMKPIFYHGYQSPTLRERTFRSAAETGPCFVVGTRSSLFLPFRELGLVIIDEEHDESFKQEDRLPYQAKEVAWFRARQCGAMLVLGSATPDVKTFHAAEKEAIPHWTLTNRVGEGELPDVELVDISSHKDPEKPFAERTIQALTETVQAGQQAIVMLNRRGYAPLMYCLDCGEAVRCPDCEVGMTYHKHRGKVMCHYCGMSKDWPMLCPKCGGANFIPMGEGTERIEEVLGDILPEGTGILRLDRDTTRKQDRMEEILGKFRRGEAQVLVGTQMLSKGHHFPNVTLVVVSDGDLGLNLPDYRSEERTFQLLVQVSGRAGRGELPGRVIIQTRNPEHLLWNDVKTGDYAAFYAREIKRRRLFQYPPFSQLALVRISYPMDSEDGPNVLNRISEGLSKQSEALGIRVLGPSPAPLSLLRGRKRFNCLLKGNGWQGIRTLYASIARLVPAKGNLRISLDLDPVSML